MFAPTQVTFTGTCSIPNENVCVDVLAKWWSTIQYNDVINKMYKSHIMDILFKASPFTEWKHKTTLVIANTCTHWCVQELVDCSALTSHYQLITLHAHTVYMYALSMYICSTNKYTYYSISELLYVHIPQHQLLKQDILIHRCS